MLIYTTTPFRTVTISLSKPLFRFLRSYLLRHNLLRHNRRHTPPKITPRPPAPFPRISIHKLEIVLQPRILKLRNIRRITTKAQRRIRLPPRLVQVDLVRICDRVDGPVGDWICRSGAAGHAGVAAGGDGGRYGGVVLRDEIAPDGHEGALEIGALVRFRGPEVARYVGAVLGTNDGVLVFPCFAAVIGEGFGDPVAGADEGGFGIDVVGALLLAVAESAFVERGGVSGARGGKVWGAGHDGGVGGGVVAQDAGDVVFGEEREGIAEESDKVRFGDDVLWCECGAFVGVVTGEHAQAVDLLFEELLAGDLLNIGAVGYREEAPGSVLARG